MALVQFQREEHVRQATARELPDARRATLASVLVIKVQLERFHLRVAGTGAATLKVVRALLRGRFTTAVSHGHSRASTVIRDTARHLRSTASSALAVQFARLEARRANALSAAATAAERHNAGNVRLLGAALRAARLARILLAQTALAAAMSAAQVRVVRVAVILEARARAVLMARKAARVARLWGALGAAGQPDSPLLTEELPSGASASATSFGTAAALPAPCHRLLAAEVTFSVVVRTTARQPDIQRIHLDAVRVRCRSYLASVMDTRRREHTRTIAHFFEEARELFIRRIRGALVSAEAAIRMASAAFNAARAIVARRAERVVTVAAEVFDAAGTVLSQHLEASTTRRLIELATHGERLRDACRYRLAAMVTMQLRTCQARLYAGAEGRAQAHTVALDAAHMLCEGHRDKVLQWARATISRTRVEVWRACDSAHLVARSVRCAVMHCRGLLCAHQEALRVNHCRRLASLHARLDQRNVPVGIQPTASWESMNRVRAAAYLRQHGDLFPPALPAGAARCTAAVVATATRRIAELRFFLAADTIQYAARTLIAAALSVRQQVASCQTATTPADALAMRRATFGHAFAVRHRERANCGTHLRAFLSVAVQQRRDAIASAKAAAAAEMARRWSAAHSAAARRSAIALSEASRRLDSHRREALACAHELWAERRVSRLALGERDSARRRVAAAAVLVGIHTALRRAAARALSSAITKAVARADQRFAHIAEQAIEHAHRLAAQWRTAIFPLRSDVMEQRRARTARLAEALRLRRTLWLARARTAMFAARRAALARVSAQLVAATVSSTWPGSPAAVAASINGCRAEMMRQAGLALVQALEQFRAVRHARRQEARARFVAAGRARATEAGQRWCDVRASRLNDVKQCFKVGRLVVESRARGARGSNLTADFAQLPLSRCPILMRSPVSARSYFLRGYRHLTHSLLLPSQKLRQPLRCALPLPASVASHGHALDYVPPSRPFRAHLHPPSHSAVTLCQSRCSHPGQDSGLQWHRHRCCQR